MSTNAPYICGKHTRADCQNFACLSGDAQSHCLTCQCRMCTTARLFYREQTQGHSFSNEASRNDRTITTGHVHGRNCICCGCIDAVSERNMRIIEPNGDEHYVRMAVDTKAQALEHILDLMGQHIIHCNATRCPGHRLADRASCDETVQLIMDATRDSRRRQLIDMISKFTEHEDLPSVGLYMTRRGWTDLIDFLEHSK